MSCTTRCLRSNQRRRPQKGLSSEGGDEGEGQSGLRRETETLDRFRGRSQCLLPRLQDKALESKGNYHSNHKEESNLSGRDRWQKVLEERKVPQERSRRSRRSRRIQRSHGGSTRRSQGGSKHPEDTRGSPTSQEYKNTKENTKVTQYLLVLLIAYYVLFVICCEPINISL